MKKPEIYLLRDHVYLIQDLIKDWTSGPPADLLYFVPITYDFQLDITQASIYLCVNEHNIINYPNSTDDNGKYISQMNLGINTHCLILRFPSLHHIISPKASIHYFFAIHHLPT
jgi:hypothetical protein